MTGWATGPEVFSLGFLWPAGAFAFGFWAVAFFVEL